MGINFINYIKTRLFIFQKQIFCLLYNMVVLIKMFLLISFTIFMVIILVQM